MRDDDEDSGKVLPPLTVGQNLDLDQLSATQTFSRHAARYTEASLCKKIGRVGYCAVHRRMRDHLDRTKTRICREKKAAREWIASIK